jgi:hypothetical protein
MPREVRKTTINGREYQIVQLGVKTARQVMVRLMRAVPSIMLGGLEGAVDLSSLNNDDAEFICEALLAGAKVGMVDEKGGGRVTVIDLAAQLDQCFAGRPLDYWTLVAFAFEENNFQEVFREVGAAFVRRLKASSTSASPTEETGTSGDSSSPTA